MPSNREIAEELDLLAEEIEGEKRKERLIQMRKDALHLMFLLQDFHPLLIGSVWRGTPHKNSDIDIVTFHNEPTEILQKLREGNIKIERTEWQSTTKQGQKKTSFHIHLTLPTENEVEIIIRSPEEMGKPTKCEIYGDMATGLDLKQLQQVLKENPLQKFVP
ncbi:MAG: nucleotidyltransferase domain-containing protein [Candidatus Bathyarchaeia archaeon]